MRDAIGPPHEDATHKSEPNRASNKGFDVERNFNSTVEERRRSDAIATS
jgi:hypothetical protein